MPEDETITEDEPILDQRLINAVNSIIDQGSYAVSKPVRAGFTTSCIKACEQQRLTLLVLSPTAGF